MSKGWSVPMSEDSTAVSAVLSSDEIRATKSAGESAILDALGRIEQKVTTHGVRLDSHGQRLDAHDSILQSHTNQLVAHSQMLTEHAKLHTEHARGVIAAQENARTARQSSSDLAKESREAMSAIGKHMSQVEKKNAEKLDALMLADEKASAHRTRQTAALEKLVGSRWLRYALIAGVFFGGVVAGLITHFFAGH
jgi:hypothetical protein